MAKVRTGKARSPDQRIVDGIREFYLGLLSKHLPMEAFDMARSDSATEVGMACLAQIRREIAARGVGACGASPSNSCKRAGCAWPDGPCAARGVPVVDGDTFPPSPTDGAPSAAQDSTKEGGK